MTQENSTQPGPETQQQRWIKYGANVVLVSIIVIVLAALVVYLTESHDKRYDTTASGLYSLKPQTLGIIKDNKQPITIISLYTKAKKGQAGETSDSSDATASVDQPGVVADLLEEYRTRGQNITTEVIDPVLSPGKVEDLIDQVTTQYGGQVKKYKTFTDSLHGKYDEIAKVASEQAARAKPLRSTLGDDDLSEGVREILNTIDEIPEKLKMSQDAYRAALKPKPPNYKGVTDSISTSMQEMSANLGQIVAAFDQVKNNEKVPANIRAYMVESAPAYTQMRKQADDIVKEIAGLGELKLDTLRDALHQENPILVRGDKEWRVIPFDKVWKTDSRDASANSDTAPKPRFAGEQQITTAILSLNQPTKPKVCFVRGGGPPKTEFGEQLNSVADRLRDYNFDVTEKDLSGMYAMQAMQQQQPTTPEPSDEDIADAIWVVDGLPQQQNPMMGGPPPSIGPKVADHLTKGFHYVDGKKVAGGSGLLLFFPGGDDLSAAVKPLGITARTDATCVHKLIKSEGDADSGDIINSAQRVPYIFTFDQWGESIITKPLSSLESILIQAAPIQVIPTAGVTSTALIPVPGAPGAPESWGETDQSTLQKEPKFNKDSDIAGPLFAAAMAERTGQRVVCMGSEPTFIGSTGELQQNIVDFPNQEILRSKRMIVPQFPGSADFFMNSIFWLSHQEPMIAISPAAMNVSRIADISKPALAFWRFGVLLIGLPGLVLLAGVGVFLSRRD